MNCCCLSYPLLRYVVRANSSPLSSAQELLPVLAKVHGSWEGPTQELGSTQSLGHARTQASSQGGLEDTGTPEPPPQPSSLLCGLVCMKCLFDPHLLFP